MLPPQLLFHLGGELRQREGLGQEGELLAAQTLLEGIVGIARDEIDFVFERMFRGQASHAGATDSRGLGLGLYLARHIVERQGGQISLVSQVDEGTIVHIELRLAELMAEMRAL